MKKLAVIQDGYMEWRAHAAGQLERLGISPGVMRERDWRQLFIRGKTPEDAARQAETYYWNMKTPFERTRRKR
jgi:hypothetical protein